MAAPKKYKTAAEKYGTTGFAGKGDKVGRAEEKRSQAKFNVERHKPNSGPYSITGKSKATAKPKKAVSGGGTRTRKAL